MSTIFGGGWPTGRFDGVGRLGIYLNVLIWVL